MRLLTLLETSCSHAHCNHRDHRRPGRRRPLGDYRIDALAHGIGSALSIPLDAGQGARGVLNLYATTPGVFTTARCTHAEGFGAEASRALRLAVRLSDQVQLTSQLETAMASRSVIDQAIGIIMGQNRCSPTAAFEILRRASNHRNIKLREIVTRLGGEPPDPAPRSPAEQLLEGVQGVLAGTADEHHSAGPDDTASWLSFFIKAMSPEDGLVIDPFAGSGTTTVLRPRARAPRRGFEVHEQYVEEAHRRISLNIADDVPGTLVSVG